MLRAVTVRRRYAAGSLRLHAIIAETSKLLKRQGCSAPQLRAYLRAAGFSIVVAGNAGIVTGGEAITLARLNP